MPTCIWNHIGVMCFMENHWERFVYFFIHLVRMQFLLNTFSVTSNYFSWTFQFVCVCVWEREREREREKYNDPFEVDNGLVSFLIMVEDGMCKLRNIMPSIAFSRNIKVVVFVFRKSLKPIQQKHIIIWCSSSIPVLIIIRCWIGVWKSYTGRRLMEQNVCSWMNRKFQKKKKN